MMKTSCNLTIFEGCNGSGKTAAAMTFAAQTNARVVHFADFPRITTGLPRMYVEAMLPALLGYQDVVLDRSWLSEAPYGEVFREGEERTTCADIHMLERLAMRCGAVVIYCNPGWEEVRKNYLTRTRKSMINVVSQLRVVYELYRQIRSSLPVYMYDYSQAPVEPKKVELLRYALHPLYLRSAGNLNGDVLLVGEEFAEHKNQDPLYQWPFASFGNEGCSRWLTEQLIQAKISERCLAWVNADQILNDVLLIPRRYVIAFGDTAYEEILRNSNIVKNLMKVEHPQHWKRFHAKQPYLPLLAQLKENSK